MTHPSPSAPQRVLVTGARRGIGRGIAYAFAEAGAAVVVNDLVEDEAAAETIEGIAERGGRGAFVQGDAAAVEGFGDLLDRAEAAFGGIDVLVNNAGVSVRQRGDILDVTPESFDRLVSIDLRAPFFLTQAMARRWLAHPETAVPRAVITISSANAEVVGPNRAEYCIAKAGLPMMTQLFGLRLAEAGIGVFEIRPGIIRTDMTAVAKDRYDRLIADGLTPIRRWGEPEDVGRAAVALASGAFHFSVGEAVHVDGGLWIRSL
jgi:NAD(P)-dependent dehydrogenase (short-subunit alcohol dehydrogenase family)